MTTSEKVAYLKGLVEGFGLAGGDSKESKILAQILDILEDLSLDVDDLDASVEELNEGLDAVSDDLEDVEDTVYGEDEDDESFDDEYYEDDADEDEDCYATTCPTCEETIYFDESVLEDGQVICPNCGEKLEFDLTSLDEAPEDGGDDQE